MGIDLKEEVLGSKEEHLREVEEFYCGPEQEALAEYLKNNAFKETKDHKQVVYLIKDLDNNIIGYYSLKANAINYSFNKHNDVKPFIELSEFAINHKYLRKGYGTYIMINFVFKKILQAVQLIGCQGMMTFALDNIAISFYEYVGFEKVDESDKLFLQDSFSEGCTLMAISTETIEYFYNGVSHDRL